MFINFILKKIKLPHEPIRASDRLQEIRAAKNN
jgi:hypothetical protein